MLVSERVVQLDDVRMRAAREYVALGECVLLLLLLDEMILLHLLDRVVLTAVLVAHQEHLRIELDQKHE